MAPKVLAIVFVLHMQITTKVSSKWNILPHVDIPHSRSRMLLRVSECTCKQWNNESMMTAKKRVEDGLGLHETARQYNVLVETLCRRVAGSVSTDCTPGPPTVLTARSTS